MTLTAEAATPSIGWAVTSDPEVLDALGLSAIETAVLSMAATGATAAEMSRTLLLPAPTVEGFLHGAYRRIGASTREEALTWAIAEGLLTPVVRDAGLPSVVRAA